MQTDTPSLSRGRRLPVALDFEALLEIGIRRAQEMSGDVWTDFNEHDPGVTILEQACFALVDIAYRASHPVVDIIDTVFADTSGATAGSRPGDRNERMARDFPMPAAALSSAPVTAGDFQALLADTFPGLRAVWITAQHVPFAPDGSLMPGQRIEALAYPERSGSGQSPAVTEDDILSFMQTHRLLGQHIAEVRLLRPVPFLFSAEIEAGPGYDPDDLIVDVLHNIDMALCPPMLFRARDTLSEMTPDALFEGPLLQAGRAAAWNVPRDPPVRTVSWVQRLILNTPGIAAVRNVTITPPDAGDDGYPVLDRHAPETAQMIRTSANGPQMPGALRLETDSEDNRQGHIMAGLNHRLALIREEMDRYRRRNTDSLPKTIKPGKRRPRLGEYYSVQYDFPAAYHLGQKPVQGDGKDEARRDEMHNLRAFLALLEQPLADMLQQIRLAPELLSSGPGHGCDQLTTYAHAALQGCGAASPPGFADLLHDPQKYPGAIARHVSKTDPHGLRYENFLDHLLARFDEHFETSTLKKFAAPTRAGKHAGARQRIRAKQDFLRDLTVPPGGTGHSPLHSQGLTTHRGSAAAKGDKADGPTALARRIKHKALLDTLPMVLEHHLLADATLNKSDHNAFFRFTGYPGPTGIKGSIALGIGADVSCDVFLHDRARIPSPATATARLHDLFRHARLEVFQSPDTGALWHIWRSGKDQGSDLVLLTPVQSARDAVFEHFASLPDQLASEGENVTISPLLFPADFGAWQMTVTAETRRFAAPGATAAYAAFVSETVFSEAPALLNTMFFPAHRWPGPQDCNNALVFTNYDAFRDAVSALHKEGRRRSDNALKIRLARTAAELAYRHHIDALSSVLTS